MFADLHIHTDYSDGIYSPESIIKKSLKAKLTKISITDHDIFLGNLEAREIAKKKRYKLEIIPGVEFSAFTQNKDCLLYTSPSPRDLSTSRMPSSA